MHLLRKITYGEFFEFVQEKKNTYNERTFFEIFADIAQGAVVELRQ